MVRTWGTGTAPDFICPTEGCGARYNVTVERFPLRDSDSASCEKCGQVMKKWNSTQVPSFTLMKDG